MPERHSVLRIATAVAAIVVAGSGLLLWQRADRGEAIATVAPPPAAPEALEGAQPALPLPPVVDAKSKEEKRFARRDRNDDGRISLDEYLYQRRRNFDRLDKNGDGRLSFEEYAVAGIAEFRKLNKSKSGALSPEEFAVTAPKPKAAPKMAANAAGKAEVPGCSCGDGAQLAVANGQQ